jgi:hypothetical protein
MYVDVWMYGCIWIYVDVWMYGCMDVWMDVWMDGWMGGWVDGSIYLPTYLSYLSIDPSTYMFYSIYFCIFVSVYLCMDGWMRACNACVYINVYK